MDNQRPELDLKFFNDICPDKNGTLSRTFVVMFNLSVSSPCDCSCHDLCPTSVRPNLRHGNSNPMTLLYDCLLSADTFLPRSMYDT